MILKRALFARISLGLVVFAAQAHAQVAGQADLRQWKIVFDSYRDGDQEIYVMNPDGSNQQRLTNRKGNDRHPTVVARSQEDCVRLRPGPEHDDIRHGSGWLQCHATHEIRWQAR